MRPLTATATVALGLGAGLIADAALLRERPRWPLPAADPDDALRAWPRLRGANPRCTMTFNIEEGGTHVSFRKVVEAIRVGRAPTW